MSLCLAPPRGARLPRRPDRPRDAGARGAGGGGGGRRPRPARQRLRPRRRAAAARRRRHRRGAVPVPLGAPGRPAGAARLPHALTSGGRRARPERGGRPRAHVRHRGARARLRRPRLRPGADAARPCAASSRRPSSPGRRRWPAATAPATAAPSRSTAAWRGSASTALSSADTAKCLAPGRVWRGAARGRVILNASGCLDALTAPEVARALDVFVTKTVTPLPREGNQPVRIAETDVGMLNSIGLANPGIDRFLGRRAPAAARARPAGLGLRRRLRCGGLRRPLRGAWTRPGPRRSS